MSSTLVCVLSADERTGWVNPSLFTSTLQLQSQGYNVQPVIKSPVSRARNYCVIQARETKADVLVMVDNDQTLPATPVFLQILAQMAARPDVDVVGMPSGMLGDAGLRWNANFLEPVGDQPFVKVETIGAGVLVLKSTVWKRLIAGPWFTTHFRDDGELGQTFSAGEDVSFCKEVKRAGLGIWASTALAGHLKTSDITQHLLAKHQALQHK